VTEAAGTRFVVRATTIGDLLTSAARAWPAAELIFPEERVTLPELDRRTDALARLLVAAGAGPGRHVGVLLPPSLELVAMQLAIAKTGATIVPINDRFRSAEIRYIVMHGDLVLLATTADAGLAGRVLEAFPDPAAAPLLQHLVVAGETVPEGTTALEAFAAEAERIPEDELERMRQGIALSDAAYLMYTSGTSAEPKGCLLSHEAFTRQGRSIAFTRYGLEPGDTFWCPLPLFHNGALATLFACLSSGASYCHAGRFDPGVAVAQLAGERCTHALPAFETIWLRVLDHPDFASADLGSLRVLLNAGSPDLLRVLQERVPWAVQLSNYGSTEAAGHFSMTLVSDPLERRLHTCGHPLPGMEARIVDPETRAVVATGERGEIEIRGVSRFSGYYKAPELTASVIDAHGWFRTGDLGSLDPEGRLAFHGRLKDMLKVGGENVAAAEVEGFLVQHPAVNVAQVVGVPDAYYTEVPAAFVELAPGASLDEAELIDHCLGRIATFKVPRYVRFVDEWPMSGTKIKKFVLREQIRDELAEAGISAAPKLRVETPQR
jgi:fatty-acyl-CoA synthase